VGVQIVGRWILARLRNRRFFSLAALNEAIRGLLIDLNDRTLRGWSRSRRQLFDELDRPALLPLPDEPYEYGEWKRCRVNLDYHVEIAKHYYSVPHGLVRQDVEARITGLQNQKRTLLNLTDFPPQIVEGFRASFKGGKVAPKHHLWERWPNRDKRPHFFERFNY
jgi:hypothetical protein